MNEFKAIDHARWPRGFKLVECPVKEGNTWFDVLTFYVDNIYFHFLVIWNNTGERILHEVMDRSKV